MAFGTLSARAEPSPKPMNAVRATAPAAAQAAERRIWVIRTGKLLSERKLQLQIKTDSVKVSILQSSNKDFSPASQGKVRYQVRAKTANAIN